MVAMAAATACTNNHMPPMEESQLPTEGKVVSVTAYAAGDKADSRVVFTPNVTDNGFTLAWDTEESFSVIRGGENQPFSKTTEGNTFTGTLPGAGTGDYYAFYPVTDAADADNVPLDLAIQTGGLDSSKTFMEATSTDGTTFEFRHRTAILKATFSGLPADGAISNIVVTASGAATITIEPTSTMEEFYIYLPPMAQADAALQFEVTVSNGDTYRGTLIASKNIEAGKVYNATVSFVFATCYLPKGETIKEALLNAIGDDDVTSIDFVANSGLTGGDPIGESSAYTLVEGNTLKVYTEAQGFVFNADCSEMFNGYKNGLNKIQSINWGDCINTASVTSVVGMFYNCSSLTSLDLSNFNTASVTNMASMFNGCQSLESLDLSNFNTASVTSMFCMFQYCSSLASLDLSSFNTASVTSMFCMFQYCSSLASLDLCSFDFKSVTDFSGMFSALGSKAATKPIPVYVKDDETVTILGNAETGISSDYAEIETHTHTNP